MMMVANMPRPAPAAYPSFHAPVGEAKGIHPGRVVWVYNPGATDWSGYDSPEHWFDSNHTDQAIVDRMMSQAIRGIAGANTDQQAWDAIFRYFNVGHGRGNRGYQSGEKIMIKLNLTTCFQHDQTIYDKPDDLLNQIDNSPQLIVALLRQLVYVVGVSQSNITIGDPSRPFSNHVWNLPHSEFPNVHYLDSEGLSGRTKSQPSTVPFYWSTTDANGLLQDHLPVAYAEMDYFIDFAILKGHSSGVTLCGKNHYGSLGRNPNAEGYYDMHISRPDSDSTPGTGHYRAIVDLMGHPRLGGKTLLCLIDGLFAGYYWDAVPRKWLMAPFGNGVTGDWPSSLFASQDQVAADSVAYDFLLNEWPNVVTGGDCEPGSLLGGAEDYLHEAALANNPPSGTFYDPDRDAIRMQSLGVHEHWNDPIHKQYSRNLGQGSGIELVSLTYDSGAIQRAKLAQNGASVIVAGAIVTAAFQNYFYIESDDRVFGIRVEKIGHSFTQGARVNVSGTVQTNTNNERYISATSISSAGVGAVTPVGVTNKVLGGGSWNYNPTTGAGQEGITDSSGLNNVGLLVRTTGRFTYVNASTFSIDDGSGVHVKCVVPTGVTIQPGWTRVRVTGVSSCEKDGSNLRRLILVRSQSDITPT